MNTLLILNLSLVVMLPEPVFITQVTSETTISHDSPALGGQLLVVELEVAGACEEPSAVWEKREVPVIAATRGYQVLVPVALGLAEGVHGLGIECEGRKVLFPIEVKSGDYPVSVLKVKSRFTRRPPRRVVRERRRIQEALSTDTLTRYWSEQFIKPTAGPLTSLFGGRREFNGKLKSRHRGVDWDGAIGAAVVASNDGMVVLKADNFFYIGNAVIIDHGQHLFSLYFHLDTVNVVEGQRVKKGDLLGGIGDTGRVTGPHLHFSTKLVGVYFNPRDLLAYQPPPVRPLRLSLQGHRIERFEEVPANL